MQNTANKFILIFSSFIIIGFSSLYGQAPADSVQSGTQEDLGDIVEAGESIIQVEVEKPQIQLFSQRIKPEFDEVNLEKSFVKEILDQNQIVKFQSSTESDKKIIDIQKVVNRNR